MLRCEAQCHEYLEVLRRKVGHSKYKTNLNDTQSSSTKSLAKLSRPC